VIEGTTRTLRDPEELAGLLGIPFTDEQLAAITAPLEPGVIVAGAGSGKTTVMAARVVWVVGTGAVKPEEVLGLTFTNKAAGELAHRVRQALARLTPGASRGYPAPPPARYPAAGDEPPGEPTISTYHAFAGRLIQEHGLRIGIEPRSRLLADATRYQLAARVLRRAEGPITALSKPIAMLVGDLIALDGELSEHLVSPERLRAHDEALLAEIEALPKQPADVRRAADAARKRIELGELVSEYRKAKRARDAIDFGDQVALAARLAEERPEVGEIERDRFRVVLLDEYQDTSVAQRRLLAGLFGPPPGVPHLALHGPPAGRPGRRPHWQGHPVTAVGDPCQAIYGWRGASVANLDDFGRHFPAGPGRDAARYSLSENRRSGGRLLHFANTLAAPLQRLHTGVVPLRPRYGAEDLGAVRCALLRTYDEEIGWVADQVRGLVDAGTPPKEIAVLVRAGADFPALHGALVERDVPVEVVGLGGLLHLPEVADVVATLAVLDDPTSNAALVRLLTGPRWRIGARDLVLLGRRARDLVRMPRGAGDQEAADPDAALAEAVAGTDPTEVVSLSDAVEWPGDDYPFSEAARARFSRLAAEIRELRRHLADPLLDLLHRVVATTGLEVELAASPHALSARRRDTLSSFLDVAASFVDVDGEVSVTAFLAFLRAAEAYERGLDSTAPTGGDSVKLLTAHKSKGLEWDVVVVPGLSAKVFPSERGRERWTSNGHVLPHDLRGDADSLPQVPGWTRQGLQEFGERMREHAGLEELRLGYVAFTRPRSLLVASGHWWGPTQRKPRGPSRFLRQLRQHCEAGFGTVHAWAEDPGEDETNPLLDRTRPLTWPQPLDEAALTARRQAAALVHTAMTEPEAVAVSADELTAAERALVGSWDRDLGALVEELRRSRADRHEVRLPASLTATQLLRLADEPAELARELARPMPRPPAPAARRGTRFHAWVEAQFAERPLLEPDDLPGAADAEIDDAADLVALQQAFLRSPYADREPLRVEAPFQLALAGRVIRGRIDAVYQTADGYEVVDWKTSRRQNADPLQLGIYRLAWAEITGVPLDRVDAAFLYVRTGELLRPPDLPDRAALERLLSG
jgi:DNA helicase II / ATP-dependent DNA helicase PcrA